MHSHLNVKPCIRIQHIVNWNTITIQMLSPLVCHMIVAQHME